jgi:hypothetical protein
MLPSAVNDTMRDMMAQIRDVGDGIRGGTYTMTAPVITGGSITGVALSGNTFTNPVITGGSINNTPIGASTANTGAFTTLSATGATTFSGATVVSGSLTANTFSSSGATITGGTINSTAIGGTTAAAGKFTTLEATGVTTVQAGTVSAPAITTSGDTNTGIFFPAADTIAFTEGGVESMRIDSSGRLLIGEDSGNTFNSNSVLRIQKASNTYISIKTGVADTAGLLFGDTDDSFRAGITYDNSSDALIFDANNSERMRIDSSGNVGIGVTPSAWAGNSKTITVSNAVVGRRNNGASILGHNFYESAVDTFTYTQTGVATRIEYSTSGGITFNTAPSGTAGNAITFTQAMTLNASGKLLIGSTTARVVGQVDGGLQLSGNVDNSSINLSDYVNDANAPRLSFGKSRGTSDGSYTIVQSGDQLGVISFSGADGTDLATIGAQIIAQVDGTPGSNDMPGRLVFQTTADGSATPTERMRIDSSGNVLVGITSARANAGDVQVSKGISFPATQSAQTDANTLDDYEEGTWTPAVGNQTVIGSFSSNGTYTKIGRQVFFRGQVIGSTSIAGAAGTYIGGLPFTSTASGTGSGTIANQTAGAIIFIGPSDTNVYIIGSYAATGNFEFSGMYFV